MNKDDLFFLGIIHKPHGFKGALNASIDSDNPLDYKKIKKIFLELNDNLVPFFLEKIEHKKGNQFIFYIEGVNNETNARQFVSKPFYIPSKEIKAKKKSEYYIHELIGVTLYDHNNVEVGKIIEIMSTQAYPTAIVEYKNKKVFIPLPKNLIISVSIELKKLVVDIPEGLLEL